MSHRIVVSAYIVQRPRHPFHHVCLGAVRQQQQSTCRLSPQTVKNRNKSSVFDAFKSGRFSPIHNHIGVPSQNYDYHGLTRRYLSIGDTSITDRETNPNGNTDPYDDDDNNDNEMEMHDVDIDNNSDEEQDDDEEEEPSEITKAYRLLQNAITTTLQSNTKQYKSLQSELTKAQQSESFLQRATLITSNLYQFTPGVTTLTVPDWENDGIEVKLELDTDSYKSAQEEAEDLYARARKMKRGTVVVQELLEKNAKGRTVLDRANDELQEVYAASDNSSISDSAAADFMDDMSAIREKLTSSSKLTGLKLSLLTNDTTTTNKKGKQKQQQKRKKNKKQTTSHTCRELISPYSGLKIHVGRNRRDNEYISFNLARGTDIWFHARGCPGAHVLIQYRRGDHKTPPTPECMQLAANLAAFYSDARTERKAVITAAEPKHIQKPRGAPLGAVKLRQELKSLVGNPVDVPEELKLAREESGQFGGDEAGTRSMGVKAKNRKKTASVVQQNQAKKRLEKREKKKRGNKEESSDSGGAGGGDWY